MRCTLLKDEALSKEKRNVVSRIEQVDGMGVYIETKELR